MADVRSAAQWIVICKTGREEIKVTPVMASFDLARVATGHFCGARLVDDLKKVARPRHSLLVLNY